MTAAADERMHHYLGWFANPLFKGDYPQCLRDMLKQEHNFDLPRFTKQQSAALVKSVDFFALNFYSAAYCTSTGKHTYSLSYYKDNMLIGAKGSIEWLFNVPWAFNRMLHRIHTLYNPSEIVQCYFTPLSLDYHRKWLCLH